MPKIISRKEARALGLTRYFTGKPCKRGHISERALAGGCIKCMSEASRQWRERNPEFTRLYYENNRENLIAYSLRWQAENPERKCAIYHRRRAKN